MTQQASLNDNLVFVADRRRFADARSQGNRFQSHSYNFQRSQISQTQPNATNGPLKKPRNTYFYTHCKMNGHNIERCFKIHGFPPGFKGNKENRVAALSQSSNTFDGNTDDGDSGQTIPSLSNDQYTQLVDLLEKHKLMDHSQNQEASSGHALLAGPLSEAASTSSW